MKVVVCQGEAIGGEPPREELLALWREELAKIPQIDEVVFRDNFNYEQVEEIAGDCDALVGVWIKDNAYDDAFFERHPKLKYIATTAHGFGKIDREAAARHGVTFTNTVYGDMTIAQFAMALLLDICHGIRVNDACYREALGQHKSVHMGRGMRVKTRQIELYEKTMGIIGLGSIGIWTAKMAAGFGMKVISYSRHKKEGEQYGFIEQVSLDELFARSDVISIHCPSTDETRGMIDRNAFSRMKDGVIIINTARGDIIVEPDLVDALNSEKVYAAGLDVMCNEPLHENTPLTQCKNAIITPHIAWAPSEARRRSISIAAQNLKNWADGNPTSVIN
ncbi:MAG: D-2-hydroxyacid dehydrogenase [Lachnospiraceae bacterium]|nr:D-2-hydroxyacid dehydrogenase [Lachnospiraceae bacterium]